MRIGKFLCAIGMHRWNFIGISVFGAPIFACNRSSCTRNCQETMAGRIYWDEIRERAQ